MSSIDQELQPGEHIIKRQVLDIPLGNLYLTNQRLLFRRSWRIGAQNITIPLSAIRNTREGLGFLYVSADKEYSFLVRFQANPWLTAIQHAQQHTYDTTPGSFDAGLTQERPPQYSPQTSAHHPLRHCPTCGRPADYIQRYERYHCYHCGKYI